MVGDKLLVISDRSEEELADTYKNLGIDNVMKVG